MAKNVKTGNKTPKKMDRQTASAQLPPLPKMYQMGISKGVEQERERFVKMLKDFDSLYWQEQGAVIDEILDFAQAKWAEGFQASIDYLLQVQQSCDESADIDTLQVAIELLQGEFEVRSDLQKESK